jgi:hypothetical protein
MEWATCWAFLFWGWDWAQRDAGLASAGVALLEANWAASLLVSGVQSLSGRQRPGQPREGHFRHGGSSFPFRPCGPCFCLGFRGLHQLPHFPLALPFSGGSFRGGPFPRCRRKALPTWPLALSRVGGWGATWANQVASMPTARSRWAAISSGFPSDFPKKTAGLRGLLEALGKLLASLYLQVFHLILQALGYRPRALPCPKAASPG